MADITEPGTCCQPESGSDRASDKTKSSIRANRSLAALLVTALALRSATIGSHGVWLDEGYGIEAIKQPGFEAIIHFLRTDISPPLHYFLLHSWTKIFGFGEFSLRMPSLICGMLLIIVVYIAARDLFPGTGIPFFSAFLITISPLAVYYSQEIRPYGLLALLAACTFLFLNRALKTGKPVLWTAYSIFNVLTFFTHYSSVPVLCAFAIIAFLMAGSRRRILQYLLAQIPLVIMLIIWRSEFAIHMHNASTNFAEFIWKANGLYVIAMSYMAFSGMGDFPRYLIHNEAEWYANYVSLAFALLLIPALRDAFDRKKRSDSTSLISLLIYLSMPCLLLLLSGLLGKYSYIPGRSDFVFYPPAAVLAAYGLNAFRSYLRYILIAMVTLMCGLNLSSYYMSANRAIDREVSLHYIPSIARPGDAVLTTTWINDSYGYYFSQAPIKLTVFRYPPDYMARSNQGLDVSEAFFEKEAENIVPRITGYFDKAPPGSALIVVLQSRDIRLKPLIMRIYRHFHQDPGLPPIEVESSNCSPHYIVGRMIYSGGKAR
jgi:4-amino-4-deoxy-L-arabinose transferase-like glycosyltransferase